MQKLMCPYVRVAMHDFPGFFTFRRVIFDYEIIYIESGTMKLEIEGKEYLCEHGDIIFLRPGILHTLSSEGIVEQPHIHFDFTYDKYSPDIIVPLENDPASLTKIQKSWIREDFLKANNINIPYVIRLNNYYLIRDTLYQIIKLHTYEQQFSELEIQSLVIKLCVDIFKSYEEQINQTYSLHQEDFVKIMKYIDEHLNQQITLDDLADSVQLSKFYLARIFKKAYNKSPLKYVATIKVKKAKDLIQFTKLSIKEIAYDLGFDSQQSFSRWFKANDGKYPQYYRGVVSPKNIE